MPTCVCVCVCVCVAGRGGWSLFGLRAHIALTTESEGERFWEESEERRVEAVAFQTQFDTYRS